MKKTLDLSHPSILLAEDRENDIVLVKSAFAKTGLPNPLFVVRDGLEVCEYLEGNEKYADRQKYPFPRLLLLDLHMPRMDGFDVLAWLTMHPEFTELAVVAFSSLDMASVHLKTLELGADDYRTKPTGLSANVALFRELHARWLSNETPTVGSSELSPKSNFASPSLAPPSRLGI